MTRCIFTMYIWTGSRIKVWRDPRDDIVQLLFS